MNTLKKILNLFDSVDILECLPSDDVLDYVEDEFGYVYRGEINDDEEDTFSRYIVNILKNECKLKGLVTKEDVKKALCEYIDNNLDKSIML